MSKIQLIILLLIAVGAVACNQAQVEEGRNQSESAVEWNSISEDAYEIDYPASWEVNKSGLMGSSFMLFSPLSNESDGFRENVNLMTQDLTGMGLTLDEYVKLSEEQIKVIVTEGELLSSERKQKDGLAYQKMVCKGKQGVFDLQFVQHYWIADNQAFVLTLTCEEDQFAAYQSIGEKILNSFTLK